MRGSAAILVIAAHVVVIYAVAVTLGVMPAPSIVTPTTAMVIPTIQQPPDPTDQPVITGPTLRQPLPPVPPPVVDVAPDSDPIHVPYVADDVVDSVAPSAGAGPVIEKTSIAVKRRIDPLYPPSARRLDQEGTVRVRILVDERGRASDVQVARSSGYDSLDAAAVSAVRRWQFVPATENSRAVSAWTEVSVVFRLDF
jgi:protein TonB